MGRGLGHGNSVEVTRVQGVNEGNILTSTPLTHTTTTHTFRDPRGRSPQEGLNMGMVNKMYDWGQVQDNVEGHPHEV